MECKELGIVYGAGNSGMYSDPEAELRSAQNDLRKKGLINDDEYQQRRKAILQSL